MNCLGENERIQGLELVETVEKESQRRSSHRLAACSSSSIIFLSVTKKNNPFPTCLRLIDCFWEGFQGCMFEWRTNDQFSIDAMREQL
jgi:hypothetical protein